MLNVAIAIEPPTESAAIAAVVRSCEKAIGDGRCRAASELKPSSVVAWYAVIRAEAPDASELRIEFHDRASDGAIIETRPLTFAARDSVESRWASAGAVIAAFVAARDVSSDAAGDRRRAPATPPLKAREPADDIAWDLDLALLAGPGLDHGPFRLGALARGYVALPQAPRVLGLLSFRYAERPGDLAISWWSASCGMGARLGGGPSSFSAELTGELAFERMTMSAEDQALAREETFAQNRFGGRLSVNLALAASQSLSLVAGAEATAMRPAVTIVVGDENAGREPAVGVGFSLGLRFSM